MQIECRPVICGLKTKYSNNYYLKNVPAKHRLFRHFLKKINKKKSLLLIFCAILVHLYSVIMLLITWFKTYYGLTEISGDALRKKFKKISKERKLKLTTVIKLDLPHFYPDLTAFNRIINSLMQYIKVSRIQYIFDLKLVMSIKKLSLKIFD